MVKGALRALVALGRDRDADPMPPQVAPDLGAAVALVTDQALGAPRSPTPAWTLDGAGLHERDEAPLFVALARRQQQDEGLAAPPRSARTWSLVLKPPRLRPSARCACPLLRVGPRRRADGYGCWSHPQKAPTSRAAPPHPPAGGAPPTPSARRLPAPTGRLGRPPFPTAHSARAGRAIGCQSRESTAAR